MLLTIERVALLQSVDIFAETPAHILASVARIVEEVELVPGENFIQEGASDNCLYLVIEGEVRVHSNEQTLLVLGPGKTVGELALLDPEPRSASVTAVNDAFLFRIDREPFDEVMADRPEIAQGIIRTLARRIREQGRVIAGQTELDHWQQ
jgi:CRP-like cAMP-binding protein